MAQICTGWILFGLFIQIQLLVADKIETSDDKLKVPTADSAKADLQSNHKGSRADSQPVDESNEFGGTDIEKRGIGKWKNIMWSQKQQGKRNLGRWKNRNWHEMQSYGSQGRGGGSYGHFLNKRFSGGDDDIKIGENMYNEIPDYGILNGDLIVPESFAYDDLFPDESDGDPEYNIEKRHRSRWNLIHRKLSQLNANKRFESMDDVKRMSSRWRIIQNKLNNLHSSDSKRSAGR